MSAKINVVATALRSEIAEIVSGSLNTSGKIRALAALKVPRAEIALLLNKKYQHVRNVLLTKLTSEPKEPTREMVAEDL